MTQFTDLGLAAPLLKALATEGYTTPTPIQAQAIPSVMAGRDLLGIAQTGTGKTAAFALPILHRLAETRKPAPRGGCRVLVLSPTRELATQIAESFRTYGKHMGVTVAVIFGGAKYGAQIKALQGGIDILVATPGRLIDHIAEKHARLGETEIFVLDEADQMLDLGFLQPIRRIVSNLPKQRQNLFFSATMPTEIGKLAGDLLTNPVQVSVAPAATTVERVEQRVVFVEAERKRELLAELFADPSWARAIVFTRTKRGADKVAKSLEAAGIPAASIHGDKSQPQREKALAGFKAGNVRALVATDIAARGIDIDAVSHVVNYELPFVPESYVHRIGRTARAGATGHAVSLCADDERALLRDIQKTTRQTIPAEDRRRDPGLAVMAKARAAQEAAEPKPVRSAGGAGNGGGRGRNAGRGGGGGGGEGRNKAPGGGQPHRGGGGRGRPDQRARGQGQGGQGGQGQAQASAGPRSIASTTPWRPPLEG
ncbi:MAG: RNA helicase [Caulobacterales bacterium 32-69-10]|nr:MAG: RNA helicase [Caulobacterales bacterium 32-69-10]